LTPSRPRSARIIFLVLGSLTFGCGAVLGFSWLRCVLWVILFFGAGL
jgi:hypothetical protein